MTPQKRFYYYKSIRYHGYKKEHLEEEAAKFIRDAEAFLREFIELSLSDTYGDWNLGINKPTNGKEGILDRWKRKRDLDLIKGIETNPNLIVQAEFSDYKQIIEDKRNWKKIYREIFHDMNKRKVQQILEELTDFRNKILSKGLIEFDEFVSRKHEFKWIKKKVGQRYPVPLDESKEISRQIGELEGPQKARNTFQDVFTAKLNECLDLIRADKYPFDVRRKYDELLVLIKKEIDAWNKENTCFAAKESFLSFYPYFNKLNFIFNGLKELFTYAYNVRRQYALDIIDDLATILYSAALHGDEAKADSCSSLLFDIAIKFLEKDFEITKWCFLIIDDAAEDMTSRYLLSKLIILGAKITQAKNQTKQMKKFTDQIIMSLEYDDRASWDINYFSYLLDSYAYIEDEITTTEEINI